MKLSTGALIAVLSLLCVACGPIVTVGAPCESRSQCLSAQECVLSAPGGFCTRGCAVEGATTDCPGGTICVFFGNSQLQCAPYCTTAADCRINYECVETGGTTAAKACRPEGAKR